MNELRELGESVERLRESYKKGLPVNTRGTQLIKLWDMFNTPKHETVEECVWDISDTKGEYMFGCGLSYLTPINAVKRYKYCPYCGKSIKIKE